MEKPVLVPTFPVSARVCPRPTSAEMKPLILDEDDGLFALMRRTNFDVQPFCVLAFKAAWGTVCQGLTCRLLRSRKATRESWRWHWRELQAKCEGGAMDTVRAAVRHRLYVQLTIACLNPTDSRLLGAWPDQIEPKSPLSDTIKVRCFSVLLAMHEFIRDEVPRKSDDYWGWLTQRYGTYPELFCCFADVCERRLEAEDRSHSDPAPPAPSPA